MTQCPVLTPAQRQAAELIKRAEQAMMVRIIEAIIDVTRETEEGLKLIPLDEFPAQHDYFVAVAHRELFLRLCGADPETGRGGDPVLAAAILNSDSNYVAANWETKTPD